MDRMGGIPGYDESSLRLKFHGMITPRSLIFTLLPQLANFQIIQIPPILIYKPALLLIYY